MNDKLNDALAVGSELYTVEGSASAKKAKLDKDKISDPPQGSGVLGKLLKQADINSLPNPEV